MTTESAFSATAPALGYIYQVRLALCESLSRLRTGEAFSVSIETLDDVSFEKGKARELLQAKHHINTQANLTDASSDLWKSLRIWIESYSQGKLTNGLCYLVTTGQVKPGSVAHYLQRKAHRNVEMAITHLNSVAASSTNKTNQKAYEVYRSLTPSQKKILLECVFILDASPTITQLEGDLKRELYHAVDIDHLEPFVRRLEGWWFSRVIHQLVGTNTSWILSEELESEKADLRDQFRKDNLPIDDEVMNATVDAAGYEDMLFVHQLKLASIGSKRILFAMKDYYRAFTQRSRWISDSLVFVGELEKYEDRLVEEWERVFAQMEDEIGEKATGDAKSKAANELYKWIENHQHPAIRERVLNPMIARGTYQLLSDTLRVGWHPEFADRLKGLLKTAGL